MKKLFRDKYPFSWIDEDYIIQDETENKLVIKNIITNETEEYETKEDFQKFLTHVTNDKLDIVCYTSLSKDFGIKSYIAHFTHYQKEMRIAFSMVDRVFHISCDYFEIDEENEKELISTIKNIIKYVKEYIKTSPETRLKYLHVEYKYGHMVEDIMK